MDELSAEVNSSEILSGEESGGDDDDDEDLIELVHVDEDFFYMAHVMRLMAALHTLVSLAMLIAYYHLKVNLEFYLHVS
jgi:ryanodine receptor 2